MRRRRRQRTRAGVQRRRRRRTRARVQRRRRRRRTRARIQRRRRRTKARVQRRSRRIRTMGAGMTNTLRQMIQTADLQTLSSRLCKEHVREQFGAEGEAMICAHEQLIKDTIDQEVTRRCKGEIEHRSFSTASGGR
jgi:hypothetical protein